MARRVRLALADLGPTFIKLGQVLSVRPDILPAAVLSELAELLSDRAVRDSLVACDDPAQMHRTLAGWAPYRPAA